MQNISRNFMNSANYGRMYLKLCETFNSCLMFVFQDINGGSPDNFSETPLLAIPNVTGYTWQFPK